MTKATSVASLTQSSLARWPFSRGASKGPKQCQLSMSLIPNFSHSWLVKMKAETDDKIVLISNFTQTLDLFEKLCRDYKYVPPLCVESPPLTRSQDRLPSSRWHARERQAHQARQPVQ